MGTVRAHRADVSLRDQAGEFNGVEATLGIFIRDDLGNRGQGISPPGARSHLGALSIPRRPHCDRRRAAARAGALYRELNALAHKVLRMSQALAVHTRLSVIPNRFVLLEAIRECGSWRRGIELASR